MSTTKLRCKLSSSTNRIVQLTQDWQNTLDNNPDIPDDIAGKIRANIGLSNLLVNDKLQQFTRLLETYESEESVIDVKITISDLEGFWDLVNIQIEDIIDKYSILELVQQNNWVEIVNVKDVGQTPIKKRLPLLSIANGTPKRSPRTDHSTSARQRLAEVKSRVQQYKTMVQSLPSNHLQTFEGSSQENIPVIQDSTPMS